MPQHLVDEWRSAIGDDQCIGQAEILPVLWTRLTWGHVLKGRGVVWYVDNESAKFALISMLSPNVFGTTTMANF